MHPRKALLSASFLLFPILLFSQGINDLGEYKAKYPDQHAIFLEYSHSVEIQQEGWDLDIRNTEVSDLFFLTETGARNYTDKYISYSSFSTIENISAATHIPKKRGYTAKPIAESDIEERSVMSGGVFYDDRKEKLFRFPGAIPGARARCVYTERILEPRFLGAYYFNSYIPIEKSSYSIRYPESVKLKYILQGITNDELNFSKKVKDGIVSLTWTLNETPEMVREDNAPNFRYTEPHLILYIEEYSNAGETRPLLNGVEGLYNWYYNLTDTVNRVKHPEIQQTVHSLFKPEDSKAEKVEAIFSWVQGHIRYIAFENGLGGFVPREAGDVFSKRYGDCKDMSSIITEMLEAADIPGELTWIGSRDIPYSYDEVPTPMVDNHMIASIDIDGERIFLDATDEYLPFGWPTAFIQGKQALVGQGESYSLFTVPVMPSDSSGKREEVTVSISEARLVGKASTKIVGYRKGDVLRRWLAAPENRKQELLKAIFEKGNNKFTVADYSSERGESNGSPMSFDYNFSIDDYLSSYKDELFVNLNLDRVWAGTTMDLSDRKHGREFSYKYKDRYTNRLEIPEGYSLDYLPESTSWDNGAFGFEISYSSEGGSLVYKKEVRIESLLISLEQLKEWNEMIAELEKAYKEVVVLKQEK